MEYSIVSREVAHFQFSIHFSILENLNMMTSWLFHWMFKYFISGCSTNEYVMQEAVRKKIVGSLQGANAIKMKYKYKPTPLMGVQLIRIKSYYFITRTRLKLWSVPTNSRLKTCDQIASKQISPLEQKNTFTT